MLKPAKTIKFTLSDLDQAVSNSETFEASNLLYLSSQSQVSGLKALHDDIDNVKSYQDLRERHGEALLGDLEKLSKRSEFVKKKPPLPEFKKEFYQEIKTGDYSKDLAEFLTVYASYDSLANTNTGIGVNNPEIVSAKMLLSDKANNETIKEELAGHLKEYKTKQMDQVCKDFGGENSKGVTDKARALLLVKQPDGEVVSVATDRESLKNLGLSEGQVDFIKTSCHQGTFEGAIAGGLASVANGLQDNDMTTMKSADFKGNTALLDLSTPDKAVLRSRQVIDERTINLEDGKSTYRPIIDSVVEVDITSLNKKESFIPGVSEKLPITTTIAIYDSAKGDIALPENTSKTVQSHVMQTMDNDCNKGYVNEIVTDGKLSGTARTKLETNMGVDVAAKLIDDGAAKTLDNWFKQENATNPKLNDAELKRVKEGIITIVVPVCTEEEKKTLEKNVGKLVRKFAAMANKEMSWSQRLKKTGESAMDFINSVRGRKTELAQIMERNPQIVESIKKNLQAASNVSPALKAHTKPTKNQINR